MSASDPAKAFCYLEQINDDRNKIVLRDSSLVITHRNRVDRFDLTQVKELSFGQRKAMLFLITGGITVPLTAVAFYRDFLHPWPTLFLLFGGIFAMYMGWRGYHVFSVQLFGLRRDYRLHDISENLRAFVNFATTILPVNKDLKNQRARMIFHITSVQHWQSHKTESHYIKNNNEEFIHASTEQQLTQTIKRYFQGKSNLLLVTIDPLKVAPEIKYEDLVGQGQLFPHIYGNLNLDAVVKVEELN